MSQTQKEIAIIVGEASTTKIFFACQTENYPVKWEYITFAIPEQVPDSGISKVDVLAQVEGVYSVSEIITKSTALEAVRKIIANNLANVKTWGEAQVLGYKHPKSKRVVLPRKAAIPGSAIYLASDEFLQQFFTFPEKNALNVGNLISRQKVPVSLNIEGLNRHLAILAQTGAGKSYTTGVLLEELLEKGATVVVLDPHSDYVYLSNLEKGCDLKFADRIKIYRNPQSTHRYDESKVKSLENYQIKFSDLKTEDIFSIMRVPETATRIKEVFYKVFDKLEKSPKKDSYTPSDLAQEIEAIANAEAGEKTEKEDKVAAKDARKYLRGLKNSKVFGSANVAVEKFLAPVSVSVLDLSGLDDKTMDVLAYLLIDDIYSQVKDLHTKYPVFLIIEEAHKFVPEKRETKSARIINTIAAEGRKFGMFLTLITQRPSKIHSDTLSQCNSQIIMKITNPLDQKAIENSSERMSKELLQDLPGLNPGEAVIVGTVTQIPVMVTIRGRKTMEGGSDLKILELLDMALKDVKDEKDKAKLQGNIKPLEGGTFSDV
ncbi:MAG: putative ATPase [Promethearchaeota archaeon CR_4]|nr:MAG: putative ATPase [Candidatus Lokiarchaeota archaeon CR_4]